MSRRQEHRSARARDYLADDFNAQANDEEDIAAQNDYYDFEDWLREVSASNPLLDRLATYLAPFLDDDPRLGGTLYPLGEASFFQDFCVPPHEPAHRARYLEGFVNTLERDHQRWRPLEAEAGDNARWTSETGVPIVEGLPGPWNADEWADRQPCAWLFGLGEDVATLARQIRRFGSVEAYVAARRASNGVQAVSDENVGCLNHPDDVLPMSEPKYFDWADYLARVEPADAHRFCATRTKKANAHRLMSPAPQRRLNAEDVWEVLVAAEGRCVYCRSFSVEGAPHEPHTKRKLAWASIGRRIGSLHHRRRLVDGGGNDPENLAWACLWCNTHDCERNRLATDHGGLHPSAVPVGGELAPAPWLKPTANGGAPNTPI